MIKSLQSNDLKETNRITILNLIRKQVRSRADIASVLGMSRPAVSSIIAELIDEGLVHEVGRGQSTETGGKRPILLDINHHACLNLAVYFNGEWYELALTDLSSHVIVHTKKKANVHSDFRETFAEILDEIQALIGHARQQGWEQPIVACGVVLKGQVNTREGKLSYTATIPEWRDVPIARYLSEKLLIPVYIENDARANALVEFQNVAKKSTLVCVTVGLGIGTGVMIDNEIFRGAYDGAVNFAHTTLADGGPLCSCGNRGCWESLASVTAFLKELEQRGLQGIDFETAMRKFHEGDPLVNDVLLNTIGYWLGVGIANISKVFNPTDIIIQGEITQAGETLRKKIEEVVRNRSLPLSKNTSVVFSEVSDMLHIKGASEFVLQHFFSTHYHREIWKHTTS